MSGWKDALVYRVYRCDNNECGCEVGCEQKAAEDWKVTCPLCEKDTLYLRTGKLVDSVAMIDINTPKTMGSMADKNRDDRLRKGEDTSGMVSTETPFWRKNKKINFDILKKPSKYVNTGKS